MTALATLAVIGVMVASDFGPLPAQTFAELRASGSRAEIICVVSELKQTAKGYLLTLMDGGGDQMQGFCPLQSAYGPIHTGSAVKVKGTMASEEDFFYIDSIALLA